jgi:hypothetical protein
MPRRVAAALAAVTATASSNDDNEFIVVFMNILIVYENFIVMMYRMKCVVKRLFDLVEMNFLRRGSAFVHIASHPETVSFA